jgi:hypothetical protein
MKTKLLFLIFVLLIINKAIAQVGAHPDGTAAEGEPINSDSDLGIPLGVKLSKAQFINTPVGILKLKGELFFDEHEGITSIELSEPQVVATPAGKLKLSGKIGFYQNKPILVNISFPQDVKTPVGMVKLKNELSFFETGNIHTISLAKEQIIETPYGKLKVSYLVFNEDGIIKGCHTSVITSIETPVGKLKVTGNIMFYETGKIEEADFKDLQ